eukprot:177157-Amphidinium_carterae.1
MENNPKWETSIFEEHSFTLGYFTCERRKAEVPGNTNRIDSCVLVNHPCIVSDVRAQPSHVVSACAAADVLRGKDLALTVCGA